MRWQYLRTSGGITHAHSIELEKRCIVARVAEADLATLERADLERAEREAAHAVDIEIQRGSIAGAELASLEARIAAERVRHGIGNSNEDAAALAKAAVRAERMVAVRQAEEALLRAEQQMTIVAAASEDESSAATTEAEQKLAEACQTLDAARAAVEGARGDP